MGLAQAFRFEQALRRADGRPGDENEGRMAEGVDEEKETAVKDVSLLATKARSTARMGTAQGVETTPKRSPSRKRPEVPLL